MKVAPGDLTQGLEEIRRRRRLVWIVFFAYMPVVILVFHVVRSERTTLVAVIVWMLLYLVAAIRVGVVRCPRCRKRFHFKRGISNPWSAKCLNCGLGLRQL